MLVLCILYFIKQFRLFYNKFGIVFHDRTDEDKVLFLTNAESVMGRKKIVIEKIPKKVDRLNAFKRRRMGIIRKANELAVMCGSRVLFFMLTEDNALYVYSSHDTNQLVQDFCNYEGECTLLGKAHEEMLIANRPDCLTMGDNRYKSKIEFHSGAGETVSTNGLGLGAPVEEITRKQSNTLADKPAETEDFGLGDDFGVDDEDLPQVEGIPIETFWGDQYTN